MVSGALPFILSSIISIKGLSALSRDEEKKTDEREGLISLYKSVVDPEWIDYNGHMTESRYLYVFGEASDAMFEFIGMDSEYRERGYSIYTVETHLCHLQEVGLGQPLAVYTQLLGYDQKRFHLAHWLEGGVRRPLLATAEHMFLHVNTVEKRSCPMQSPLNERLAAIWEEHSNLPQPGFALRSIQKVTPS